MYFIYLFFVLQINNNNRNCFIASWCVLLRGNEETLETQNTAKQEYRCFQKYCQPLGESPLLSNYKEAKILIHRVIKCIDNFFHLDTNPSDVLCIPFIFLINQYVNIIVYFSNTIKYYCSKVLKGIVRQLLLFYCHMYR